MVRDIDVLNEEMEAAGARISAFGLSAASSAKSLRAQPLTPPRCHTSRSAKAPENGKVE